MTRVLGICGSLRRRSHNATLLRSARELLPDGVHLGVWSGLRAVPPFDEDRERRVPEAVQELRIAAAGADALLVATPEYNRSLPGQLKNALDWLSRPDGASAARGKPAAVVGASTGAFGAVWAQAETRKVLAAMGAHVVETELPVPFADGQLDSAIGLADAELRARYESLLAELLDQAPVERTPTATTSITV